MVDVGIEKENTGVLIEVVGKESLDAQVEADAAAITEAETKEAEDAAKLEKATAQAELAEAVPAMERA
jgi:hypothetical protein